MILIHQFSLISGDGRICIASAIKYNCHSIGCEIESKLCTRFQSLLTKYNLHNQVKVINDDLLNLDLADANIIICYLLPEAIELLKGKFYHCLQEGVILICNTWGPKGFKPSNSIICGEYNNITLYKYDISSIVNIIID